MYTDLFFQAHRQAKPSSGMYFFFDVRTQSLFSRVSAHHSLSGLHRVEETT